MKTPDEEIMVGDTVVTASDLADAIKWLEENMGTEFTFTQGMTTLSNPLAAWSAKRGYKGLKKNPYNSTIPAKGRILDYLRNILMSAETDQALETAWIATEKSSGQGYIADSASKVAIEMRAMTAARDWYAELGWLEDTADASAYKHNSFDLILHRNGETKHVEVKGTTQKGADFPRDGVRVFLTPNEVAHARGKCKANVKCHSVGLFVLTDVKVTAGTNGLPTAMGGIPYVYDPWRLNDGALEPSAYSYRVPGK